MSIRDRAAGAIREALIAAVGRDAIDAEGYVRSVDTNLLGGLTGGIRADFAAGAGHELEAKMRAPHSSSALAVNVFAPWRAAPQGLELAGASGFTELHFEKVCPTGLRGTSPHLDVVASNASHVIAVESKCLEYLTPKAPAFADAYAGIDDARSRSRWFKHVAGPASAFRHLDAAQLVKHYLGLAREYEGRSVTLLYLYWEPSNWRDVSECVEHRAELQRFAYSVSGDPVRFASLSYPELWDIWAGATADHVAALRRRYAISV